MLNVPRLCKVILSGMTLLLQCSASPLQQANSTSNVELGTMLDGSLGELPALFVAAQGLMAELNRTDTPAPSSPGRTDKENGAALGGLRCVGRRSRLQSLGQRGC
jgi:hypothetical protein